ncbi:transposase [Streptomyces sp. NPDC057592]|uniref:transposase n=1 Tax=unclassified Streptomyces TaxID=2593676 RepID=UPI0036BC27DA
MVGTGRPTAAVVQVPPAAGRLRVTTGAVFTAVVYVLTSGCAWRHLPETFGVSPATAHRRFTVWTQTGL